MTFGTTLVAGMRCVDVRMLRVCVSWKHVLARYYVWRILLTIKWLLVVIFVRRERGNFSVSVSCHRWPIHDVYVLCLVEMW